MAKPEKFDASVFINCPFDDKYKPLLLAIVFTVMSCGFLPRSALEKNDAGEIRLNKIKKLIAECRLGIHDISRTELDSSSNLPRFNMPFELGLDLGAREYGSKHMRTKRVLIFERDQYQYQKFLSDIAGQDISAHADSVTTVITKVRTLLNNVKSSGAPLLGAPAIEKSFNAFSAELPKMCQEAELDPNRLDYGDFVYFATLWIEQTA